MMINNYLSEIDSYLAFSYFQKIGPKTFARLLAWFPNIATAYRADYAELTKSGVSQKTAAAFCIWRKQFNLETAKAELQKHHINYISILDNGYPKLLKEIYDPPFILYYRGNIQLPMLNRLAIVGAREHSNYAPKIINALMPELARHNIVIVSGLAKGVDALAHRAALAYNTPTIAVLGSGLNPYYLYPNENRNLAEKIISAGGALVSEFPPSTPPLKINFPRRNRIIAGLCQAVMIVEAGKKSGSLITASCALDQNRDILAVPGNIFSEHSTGPNNLIQSGAKLITGSVEILESFGIKPTAE